MNDGQRALKALQLEKEREIMKEIFKEKREKIRKDNRIAIDTNKFVKESDDLNKILAKDTVGLVHLNQFQKIREDIETEERDGLKNNNFEIEQEKKRKRMQQTAARLSFEIDELISEEQETDHFDSSVNDSNSIENDNQDQDLSEDNSLKLVKSLMNKKSRLGADPNVKSYFEASDYAAATFEAIESSKQRKDTENNFLNEKRKSTPVRLTLSFYDGADHRFCVDFKRGDRIIDVLRKCRLEYGPLRGVLVEDLILVKENLIVPTDLSVFDLEELGALKDGGRGPYRNSDLFSFILQAKDQKHFGGEGASGGSQPLTPDEMIETDASRNAKICTKTWFERNKQLVPAKYWFPFDVNKHCRRK